MRAGFICNLLLITVYMCGYALCVSHSIMTLSVARFFIATTSVDNYALFGGGITEVGGPNSNVVDIYDIGSGNWTVYNFAQARGLLAATSVGRFALFGGGQSNTSASSALANVNIFDSINGNWTTASLSQPRYSLTATSVGKYALFAGGFDSASVASAVVDIFNSETLQWTNATLSLARSSLSSTTTGRFAFFAGGVDNDGIPTTTVDIFDSLTGTWNTSVLSTARSFISAGSVGNIAYFAAGSTSSTFSSVVDYYNSVTRSWEPIGYLPAAKSFAAATTVGNRYLVGGGFNGGYLNAVNYYPIEENFSITEGTLEALASARAYISALTVGPLAMFAGGYTGAASNVVDVYDHSTEFDIGTKPHYKIVPILECVDQNGIAHFGYQSNETQTVILSQMGRNHLSPQYFFPVINFHPGRSRYYPLNPSSLPLNGPGPFTWQLDNFTLTFSYDTVPCPTSVNVILVTTVTGWVNATQVAEIMRQTFATLNSLPLSRVVIVSININQNKKRVIVDNAELTVELSVIPSTTPSDPTPSEVVRDFVSSQQPAYQTSLKQNIASQELNISITTKDAVLNPTNYIEGMTPQAPVVAPVEAPIDKPISIPMAVPSSSSPIPSTSPTSPSSVPQIRVSESVVARASYLMTCVFFIAANLF